MSGAVGGQVRTWLRLEGLAVLVASCVIYGQLGAGWGRFALLFLVPDVSFAGYLAGPRAGAAIYNAVHTYVGPIALAIIAALGDHPALLPFALIWTAHIGLDRMLGFGLKYPTAFAHTHLSWKE